jgi:hypothetical protein
LVSSEDSVSSCLETEGSVLELTSDLVSCSGMLSLGTAVKDRTVVAVKAGLMKVGLVQVWIEIREAIDVRVRLVENIVSRFAGRKVLEGILLYLLLPRAATAAFPS